MLATLYDRLASSRSAQLRAAFFAVLATALLATMHALVRRTSQGLHPFEIAFFRNLFGLLTVTPFLIRAGRGALRTQQPRLQMLRSALGIIALLSWFYGLSRVPIAQATALSFSAVIFATLGASFILHEKLHLRRWLAVGCSFAGTLIVLRPGFHELNVGVLVILLSSVCWGTNLIIVKRLSGTDETFSVVAWMSIMMTVLAILPAVWVWRWPTMEQTGWLLLVGLTGGAGQLAMTKAMQLADASVVVPLDFTRLLWTSLIGYWWFAEIPDLWTWIGGAVIFLSSALLTYRESRSKFPHPAPVASGKSA
ncbi:MAG: DMT family transporter [Gammaproteobacteria bacterium]